MKFHRFRQSPGAELPSNIHQDVSNFVFVVTREGTQIMPYLQGMAYLELGPIVKTISVFVTNFIIFVLNIQLGKYNQLEESSFNNIFHFMIVHLIDGTYELFRHFYGQRSFNKGKDKPFGAMIGVLHGILEMIEDGATHIGVATDHVIESFRNKLWPGYKTGAGIERALLAQFHPLEKALESMGVVVWPMVEVEADDALASAAYLAAKDSRVLKVCIWTPDKDLAQCVREDRVVQVDRKAGTIRDADAIYKKFGVSPLLIPDFLALVGDSADGYPGITGIGKTSAARLLNQYGPIESFPKEALGTQRKQALLFKRLATLRTDVPLFKNVDQLRWVGPTKAFAALTTKLGDPRLLTRAKSLKESRSKT